VHTTDHQVHGVAEHANGCVISVIVAPRSSTNRIEIDAEGTIRVRLTAPPVDGAANASLLKFMAKVLGVPRTNLSVITGSQSRHKRLLAEGTGVETAWARLSRAAGRET
jgi:uncharacterized protein (TIGR00251 family)